MSNPRLLLPDTETETVEAGVLGVGLWKKLVASLKLLGGGKKRQIIEYKGLEVQVEAQVAGGVDGGRVQVIGFEHWFFSARDDLEKVEVKMLEIPEPSCGSTFLEGVPQQVWLSANGNGYVYYKDTQQFQTVNGVQVGTGLLHRMSAGQSTSIGEEVPPGGTSVYTNILTTEYGMARLKSSWASVGVSVSYSPGHAWYLYTGSITYETIGPVNGWFTWSVAGGSISATPFAPYEAAAAIQDAKRKVVVVNRAGDILAETTCKMSGSVVDNYPHVTVWYGENWIQLYRDNQSDRVSKAERLTFAIPDGALNYIADETSAAAMFVDNPLRASFVAEYVAAQKSAIARDKEWRKKLFDDMLELKKGDAPLVGLLRGYKRDSPYRGYAKAAPILNVRLVSESSNDTSLQRQFELSFTSKNEVGEDVWVKQDVSGVCRVEMVEGSAVLVFENFPFFNETGPLDKLPEFPNTYFDALDLKSLSVHLNVKKLPMGSTISGSIKKSACGADWVAIKQTSLNLYVQWLKKCAWARDTAKFSDLYSDTNIVDGEIIHYLVPDVIHSELGSLGCYPHPDDVKDESKLGATLSMLRFKYSLESDSFVFARRIVNRLPWKYEKWMLNGSDFKLPVASQKPCTDKDDYVKQHTLFLSGKSTEKDAMAAWKSLGGALEMAKAPPT